MNSYFSRWEVLLAWLTASMLIFAAAWGSVPGTGGNPLPGLRHYSSNLWVAWPAAAYALLIAVVLTRDRNYTGIQLRMFAASSVLVWLILATLVSSGACMGLAFISGWLFREARKRG